MSSKPFLHPATLVAVSFVLAGFLGLSPILHGGENAENPVLWADVPDISIVRVGDTYYMSSTTMHLSPGLPVMKSKNLVDWDIASYAYDVLEDNDALCLRNGKNAYGAGTWASSIRHHDGTFYVSTFAGTTGKTYVFSSKDPDKGDWHRAEFRPMMHDHSLFFDDDGRVYMLYGATDLRLTELQPDLSGIKPGGFDDIVVRKAGRAAGSGKGDWAEGSQLFKIDGKYYLCNICWPKNDMRTQLIHRADKITGPYEGRVMLHDRGIAQGGLIDTPDGRWYAYLFQDSGAVGRIPYLVPLKWEDGWPVLGEDGKVPMKLDIPKQHAGLGNLVASDEFDRSAGDNRHENFPPAWQWNHQPDDRFWSLSDRPGWLRLTAGRVDAHLLEARNSLGQRTFGPSSSATTRLDVSGMKDGDYAGIAAFQRHYGFVGVKKTDGKYSVIMVNTKENDQPNEVTAIPWEGDLIHLKIDCDFANLKDEARFFWSENGEDWKEIGSPVKMRYTLPHFMGYRFTLFHFATKTPGGFTDFDYYRVR